MRRLHKPVIDWTLADVEALIAERVPEGQRIEYKQELKLGRESDRRETAKDLSGFANASGGLIFYGVAEDDSDEPVPVRTTPLTDPGAQTRLEDIVDSAISPRLEMHVQPLQADGGVVLVVRVEPRSGGLHMVEGYKQYRYFIRRGTRTVPMTEGEVRAAYEALAATEDRLFASLQDLPLMPRIARVRSPEALALRADGITPEWLPWVSVVVAPLGAPHEFLRPADVRQDAFPESSEHRRGQAGVHSGRYDIDAFGLVDESLIKDRERMLRQRLRLYRSGVFEWGQRWSQDDWRGIPSSSFADAVYNVLAYFASVYERVNYFGRVAVWVRVDNAEEALLRVSSRYTDWPIESAPGIEFMSAYETTSVDALLADPLPVTRNAMERIWQGFGYSTCFLFDQDGGWRRG